MLADVRGVTIIAHIMGCLIAMNLATRFLELGSKLILLGPPPSPLPRAVQAGSLAGAALVRSSGIAAVVDAVVSVGTSTRTKTDNPLAVVALRMSLLGQDHKGYAKGCTALAHSINTIPVQDIRARTLIITGDEDKVSPPSLCDNYVVQIKDARLVVLPQIGLWHVFEDFKAVSAAVKSFL